MKHLKYVALTLLLGVVFSACKKDDDNNEITLNDLTPEDRQVIIEIRMQNESGNNIKN